MSSPLSNLIRSPLGRRPGLLLEKVRARLIGAPKVVFQDRGPAIDRAAFAPVCRALEAWRGKVEPVSETRVFGRDFALEDLLARCAEGPDDSMTLLGDIKLIWEFSRSHSLPVNALALPEQEAAERGARFVRTWSDANIDPNGPAWTCAMEVAIRAVNWIVADALLSGRLAKSFGAEDWSCIVWNHGHMIRNRLEARLISSNHYLANLLGLAYVGACFPDDPKARAWSRLAAREFPRALSAQSYADGGVYEASLPYHGLVLEMAIWFAALHGSMGAKERAMAQCAVDMEGFKVGDDDSGRILPAAPVPALAEAILERSFKPAREALYRDSGWWVCRNDRLRVHLTFGDVGMAGLGAHAHNDRLSVCLEVDGRPILVDPGSYLYTPDPEARNTFRSARSHNTIMLNNRDHRVLPCATPDDLFRLPETMKGVRILSRGAGRISVETELTRIPVTRSVSLGDSAVRIEDRVECDDRCSVSWRFHLAPGLEAALEAGGVRLGELLTLFCDRDDMKIALANYDYSPRYGTREPARVVEATLEVCGPVRIGWTMEMREVLEAYRL